MLEYARSAAPESLRHADWGGPEAALKLLISRRAYATLHLWQLAPRVTRCACSPPPRPLIERDNLVETDCLISNIDLPKINSLELLHLVHKGRPKLPVMLITGHPELVDRSSPISRSRDRLFRKPFEAEELLAAATILCGTASAWIARFNTRYPTLLCATSVSSRNHS